MYVDGRLVSPKFHMAYEANEWLLLPETRIIEAYYNARNTPEFPKFEVR
jgi:hypothetical protein